MVAGDMTVQGWTNLSGFTVKPALSSTKCTTASLCCSAP